MLDRCGRLLMAALGFAGCQMPSYDRALWALRTWLTRGPASDTSPSGCTARATTCSSPQYDDRGWRATFYTTGMEHSPTSATGTAWEPTPWRVTQRAAWEVLTKAK